MKVYLNNINMAISLVCLVVGQESRVGTKIHVTKVS